MRLLLTLFTTLLFLLEPLSATADIIVRDDNNHELHLPRPAQRIVSLAPHITEVLFAAGAGEHVVGTVSYSDYPEAARSLAQVGSYNNIDIEAIVALRPDLVIAWRSGNRSAHLDQLAALGIPVYVEEARRFEGVALSLEAFGRLAGTESIANQAAADFRARHDALAQRYADRSPVRMFYQIWSQPLMTLNGEHLVSDAIRLCGGINVFDKLTMLAPSISVEAVLAANPEVIIASGENASRPEWLDVWQQWPELAATASGNLYFIAPELILRHTPRFLDGTAQLCEQLEAARAKRSVTSRN